MLSGEFWTCTSWLVRIEYLYRVILTSLADALCLGPSPTEVANQYAQIVGTPAEVQYWSLGLHQCRYGYTGKSFLPLC